MTRTFLRAPSKNIVEMNPDNPNCWWIQVIFFCNEIDPAIFGQPKMYTPQVRGGTGSWEKFTNCVEEYPSMILTFNFDDSVSIVARNVEADTLLLRAAIALGIEIN